MLFYIFLLQTFYFVKCENVTVDDQLVLFKERTNGPIGTLTLSTGEPVYRDDVSAINENVLTNQFFMDSFQSFDRERIPTRVVHGKGNGALGYFEVTNDITHICKAKLFNEVGKRTNLIVRFSQTFTDAGGSDTTRDNRGMAVKFYTEEGNLDLLALATEIFVLKDPIKFVDFVHSFRKNPVTNTPNENSRWDYLTNNPEALFVFLTIFSDIGIADGNRFLPGFTIHPFQVYNENGDVSFVKFNFRPIPAPKTLTNEEAAAIQGNDLDYASRDLYNAILNDDYPTWNLTIKVLTADEVKNANFDVFDITKLWPTYVPEIEVGRIVLDKLPENFFAEIEQVALCPSNLVPGILGGVDSVLIARRFSYRDTQLHRLGANFNKIHVNRPVNDVYTYLRDGQAPVGVNGKDAPNYYPNSFNGPEVGNFKKPKLWNPYVDPEPRNADQIAEYINELSDGERDRLVANIVLSLNQTVRFIQKRGVKLLKSVYLGLGEQVEERL